jgi:hypothetical protein
MNNKGTYGQFLQQMRIASEWNILQQMRNGHSVGGKPAATNGSHRPSFASGSSFFNVC